jgi:hypothetical protein
MKPFKKKAPWNSQSSKATCIKPMLFATLPQIEPFGWLAPHKIPEEPHNLNRTLNQNACGWQRSEHLDRVKQPKRPAPCKAVASFHAIAHGT